MPVQFVPGPWDNATSFERALGAMGRVQDMFQSVKRLEMENQKLQLDTQITHSNLQLQALSAERMKYENDLQSGDYGARMRDAALKEREQAILAHKATADAAAQQLEQNAKLFPSALRTAEARASVTESEAAYTPYFNNQKFELGQTQIRALGGSADEAAFDFQQKKLGVEELSKLAPALTRQFLLSTNNPNLQDPRFLDQATALNTPVAMQTLFGAVKAGEDLTLENQKLKLMQQEMQQRGDTLKSSQFGEVLGALVKDPNRAKVAAKVMGEGGSQQDAVAAASKAPMADEQKWLNSAGNRESLRQLARLDLKLKADGKAELYQAFLAEETGKLNKITGKPKTEDEVLDEYAAAKLKEVQAQYPGTKKGRPTKAVALEYVKKFGAVEATRKLAEDGYDTSGYAD